MNQVANLSWRESFLLYKNSKVIAMFFLGFSAGLPLLLVFSTLSAWLGDLDISRSAIGFFAWVGITYSIKVLWAPVVDRIRLPFFTSKFGQRRGWMLIAQLGIASGLVLMAITDPLLALTPLALAAVLVAFSSATQDIAIDAFRIESAIPEYQAAMSATYIYGYRLAMLVAGAGALYIADFGGWQLAYLSMAALVSVGTVTVLLVTEPENKVSDLTLELETKLSSKLGSGSGPWIRLSQWFISAVVSPFVDFFQRNGRFALLILAFVGLFRVSDIIMGIMANPFYIDLGFTLREIADISKVFGFFMTLFGTFLGGLLVARFGLFGPLIIGATCVCLTNLLFALLAGIGADVAWLAIVISADNLSAGFSNVAFIAYLSSLTNRAYTATQYALFSSFMTLPGKFVSGFSGVVVDASGYAEFFIYASVMGIPAIILSILLWKYQSRTH